MLGTLAWHGCAEGVAPALLSSSPPIMTGDPPGMPARSPANPEQVANGEPPVPTTDGGWQGGPVHSTANLERFTNGERPASTTNGGWEGGVTACGGNAAMNLGSRLGTPPLGYPSRTESTLQEGSSLSAGSFDQALICWDEGSPTMPEVMAVLWKWPGEDWPVRATG